MRNAVLLMLAMTSFVTPAMAGEYERRLIPLTVVLAPGAFATTWTTRVAAVQELETAVEILGDTPDMPGSVGRSQPYRLFPLPSVNEPPGSILYVPRDAAGQVHVSARVVRTGEGVSEETVLPVVSEDEFVDRTLYFLQLTAKAEERIHLRAYSLDVTHPEPFVRVRVQATWTGSRDGWAVVYDQLHALTAQQKQTSPGAGGETYPLRPLSVELSLEPVLRNLPEGAELAVSVRPVAEGLRIWALLSETNNATQRVRVALPD
jgi:hypothetical protein